MSFNFIDKFLERLNLFSTLKNGLKNLNWDNSMTYRILDCAIFDSLKFGHSEKANKFFVAFFTEKLGKKYKKKLLKNT